jgi:hypothetical protein
LKNRFKSSVGFETVGIGIWSRKYGFKVIKGIMAILVLVIGIGVDKCVQR